MDDSQKNYAKLKKPDTKGSIPYGSIYMTKKAKPQGKKSRQSLPERGVGGETGHEGALGNFLA